MPSRKYKEYESAAEWHLRPRPTEPINYPIEIKCLFFLQTRRAPDLTNLLEAVDDVLTHAGIIEDDNANIVVSHDGSRCYYDKFRPRTEITIYRLPGPEQLKISEE